MRPQTVAWNGIRLKVPGGWEVSGIAHRYLAWESDGRSALELRWDRPRGRFSFERTLKGLLRGRFRRSSLSLSPWSLPEAWPRILAHHRMRGFGWQTAKGSGHGLLLHCRRCATATLIQVPDVPDRPAAPDGSLWELLLRGFEDHDEKEETRLWRVFDIQTRLPQHYRLKTFRFQPGHFRLEFSGNQTELSLHRWSAAGALLGDGDLTGFALGQGLFNGTECEPQPGPQGRDLEWRLTGSGKRFWRPRQLHQAGRIWHLEAENRILGVVLRGKAAPDPVELDSLAATYGLAAT